MKFIVSDKVRRETNCPHDFSCLTDGRCGKDDQCDVVASNGQGVLFLKPTDKTPDVKECLYRVPFKNGYVCICPIHNDIYRQSKRQKGIQ